MTCEIKLADTGRDISFQNGLIVWRFNCTLHRFKTPCVTCSKASPEHVHASSVFHCRFNVFFFLCFISTPRLLKAAGVLSSPHWAVWTLKFVNAITWEQSDVRASNWHNWCVKCVTRIFKLIPQVHLLKVLNKFESQWPWSQSQSKLSEILVNMKLVLKLVPGYRTANTERQTSVHTQIHTFRI